MKHYELSWKTHDRLTIQAGLWRPDETLRAAICLVHGLGEHSGRYQWVIEQLCGRGFAVLGADLRGHGRSEGKRGHTPSYKALMDDINLQLNQAREQFPQTPLFLYGHSLGGNLVINFLLREKPDLAGVVASSPALLVQAPPSRLLLGRILSKIVPALTMPNGLSSADLSHSQDSNQAYQRDPLVHNRISARLAASFIDAGHWAIAQAGNIEAPLLIIHGSADPICPVEGSRQFAQGAESTGNCTLKIWDGLLHELHNEASRTEIMEYVSHWLETQLDC